MTRGVDRRELRKCPQMGKNDPMSLRTACLFLILALSVATTVHGASNARAATPRQAMQGFLKAGAQSDFSTAQDYLDLRDVPARSHDEQGRLLAQELYYVLDHHASFDPSALPDEQQPSDQGDQVVATSIPVNRAPVPIALTRIPGEGGTHAWLISRATMASVPSLYREYGPPAFYFRLPPILRHYQFVGGEAWQWLGMVLFFIGAWLAAHVTTFAVTKLAMVFARRTTTKWDDALVLGSRRPLRLLLAVAIYEFAEPWLDLPASFERATDRIARIVAIVATAWLLLRALAVGTSWAEERLVADPKNELDSRGVRTQLLLMRRIGTVFIAFFSAATVLLQFEFVRSVGVSLIASAGLAGVVLGVAAQKSLAGVIAGIQVSLTQPFRIGDAVVVEGEFGHVEEINLTYVVIHVWDQRRLIVPIQRVLEQPFQNWTRGNPEMLGTIFMHCDYATPVAVLRAELQRMCAAHPSWDGRICELAVTDTSNQSIELRAVVSARDADALWKLRCDLREQLVSFLGEHEMGSALPRSRIAQLAPS
jgi:small-conductance mechanosensitive channel